MKLLTLAVALAALAFPMGLVVLHPSTRPNLAWDGGGSHRIAHAAPRLLASR